MENAKKQTKEFLDNLLEASFENKEACFSVIDSFYGVEVKEVENRHVRSAINAFVLKDNQEVSIIKELLNEYRNAYCDKFDRSASVSSVTHFIECIDSIEPIADINNKMKLINTKTETMLSDTEKMLDKIDEAQTEFENVKTEFNDVRKEFLKSATESNEQLKATQSSFVSILGIFSSITFGLFGGLSMLASVMEQARDMSDKDNVLVMVGSCLLILTALIVMLGFLLSTVGNIIGKTEVLPKARIFKWMLGPKWLVMALGVISAGLIYVYFII